MAHTFNPSTQEAEAGLVYRVNSRTARATQRLSLIHISEPTRPLYN